MKLSFAEAAKRYGTVTTLFHQVQRLDEKKPSFKSNKNNNNAFL